MLRLLWLTLILVFIAGAVQSQNDINVTDAPLTLVAKDIHLRQVLRHLHDQYAIEFAYDEAILDTPIRGNFNIVDGDFPEDLTFIFKSFGLEADFESPDKVLLRKSNVAIATHPTSATIVIKGIIKDVSQKPISFALVSIPAGQLYTTPDENGFFTIAYPESVQGQNLKIQLLGFETYEAPLQRLSSGQLVTVTLEEDPILVDEIVIIGRPTIPLLSSTTPNNRRLMTQDQLKRSSAYLLEKDLLRSLQFLPGISGHNEEGGSIEIRGASADNTMILLDKIPLYSPSHFYGIFSAINPNYIESIELYKNNYPIQYGGKTGGMVKIGGPSSIPTTVHGNIGIDLLHASGNINIPISSDGVISLSARSTIGDISNSNFYSIGNDTRTASSPLVGDFGGTIATNERLTSNPIFGFRDMHGKWKQTIQKHEIELNAFYSDDDLSNTYDIMLNNDDPRNTRMNRLTYTNIEEWSNIGASLYWQWNIQDKFSLNTTAYTTNNEKTYNLTSSLIQDEGTNGQETYNVQSFQNNTIHDISLDIHGDYTFSENQRIIIGSKIIRHKIEFIADRDTERLLGNNDRGSHLSGYAQWISKWNGGWTARLGIRANYFTSINRSNISPVIEFGYQPTDNFLLKTSYSQYDQYQRSFSYENSFGQTIEYWALGNSRDIPIANCSNYMLGFQYKLNMFYIDVEAYYRDFTGVLEVANSETGFSMDMGPPPTPQINSFVGRGNTKGIDVGLGYENKIINTILSYTLSKSVNRFPEILMGHEFPSQNDRRHQLKSSNSYKFNNWSIGLNYVFASGKPYTDLNSLDTRADRRQIPRSERINLLPDYYRFDVGLDRDINLKDNKISIGISVLNILDRQNVKYIQNIYSIETQNSGNTGRNEVVGTEGSLLGRTLNLNINYSF